MPDAALSDALTAINANVAPYRHPIRIYWEDTDAGGVVFYANYLKFFERARTEWLRERGFAQERLRVEEKVMFVVTDTSLRYLRPARLDDLISVSVVVTSHSAARITLMQQAFRDAELLAEGTIRIASVDAGTFRPCRIPISILKSIG